MTKSIAERTGGRVASVGFVMLGWMYAPSGLGLYGDLLIIYAQIYNTTQHEQALWIMSDEWFEESLGIDHTHVQACVDELIDRHLVRQRGICADGRMLLDVDQAEADDAMRSEIVPASEPLPTSYTIFPRGKKKPHVSKQVIA